MSPPWGSGIQLRRALAEREYSSLSNRPPMYGPTCPRANEDWVYSVSMGYHPCRARTHDEFAGLINDTGGADGESAFFAGANLADASCRAPSTRLPEPEIASAASAVNRAVRYSVKYGANSFSDTLA